MVASALDWTAVAVSAITAVPATIAALGVLVNRRMLKTPSKKPIGAQAESANALSAATLVNLLALMRRHNIEPVPHENVIERADEAINGLAGDKPSVTLAREKD